jgi:hypothetical protein
MPPKNISVGWKFNRSAIEFWAKYLKVMAKFLLFLAIVSCISGILPKFAH